jgi:thiol-disulfide isomerase/thioredoxin
MLPDRLLAFVMVALGLTTAWLTLRWRSRLIRRRGGADLVAQASGLPVVLAFSTTDCIPCKTIQKPALDDLVGRYPGQVRVRDVDASTEAALARRFGILTVPSTVVIRDGGAIVAVNQGPAGWEKLAGQLGLNGRAKR